MPHRHNLLREGVMTGVLGAATVAVWFLVTDALQGRPFTTPSILGQIFLYGNTSPEIARVEAGPLVAYSLTHLAAFVLFGIVITELVHLAMGSPLARFALLLLAVVFELFFAFVLFAISEGIRALFPSWSVLIANALSLTAMGVYLLRSHPGLKRRYQREPLGA